MTIQGEGRQETINASGSIHLNGHNSNTIIAYKGTLTPGKRSALLPPTLLRGAARHFIQQFFSALAEQLRTSGHREIVDTEEVPIPYTLKQPGGTIVIVPPPASEQHTSVLPTLPTLLTHIRWCGLGEGDPVEEARWESRIRIRRAGMISGLLLLVWIGTRLPRKPLKQAEEHP